jgi:hypothetical protein
MRHLQKCCSVSERRVPDLETTHPAAACYRIANGNWSPIMSSQENGSCMFWITSGYHPHDWGHFEYASSLLDPIIIPIYNKLICELSLWLSRKASGLSESESYNSALITGHIR